MTRRGRDKPKCTETLRLPSLNRKGVTFVCVRDADHKGEHDWQPK